MAHTLHYRLEQNQEKRDRLSETFKKKRDREVYRAICWIAKKEPELACALVGRNHDDVFKQLCKIYGGTLWSPADNTRVIWLKYSLTAYLWRCLDFFEKVIQKEKNPGIDLYILIIISFVILYLYILGKGFLILFFILTSGEAGAPLILFYLASILCRIFIRIIVIKYNLAWDSVICRWYSFQNKHSKQMHVLEREEEEIRKSIQNIDTWELERFSAPPKNKRHRRL